MYRPDRFKLEPEAATGVKPDHVPSGAAVLPVRALMPTVEPDALQLTALQFLLDVASNTREVKIPDEAYGETCTQSIGKETPEFSLAIICIEPPTA